jgi:hypothetical protein
MDLYNEYIRKTHQAPTYVFLFWLNELHRSVLNWKKLTGKNRIQRYSSRMYTTNLYNLLTSIITNDSKVKYGYGYYPIDFSLKLQSKQSM